MLRHQEQLLPMLLLLVLLFQRLYPPPPVQIRDNYCIICSSFNMLYRVDMGINTYLFNLLLLFSVLIDPFRISEIAIEYLSFKRLVLA